MTTSVSLTRATRDTITSLRSAIDQANVASQRISTGKRVNSATDDPASYFTSQSLSDDAAELDRIMQDLTQGIQVVKAADQGMTSITKLVEAAKVAANGAANSGNAFDRLKFAQNWNGLLSQMEGVANDSGYRGKNILAGTGHDLKLYIGDSRNEAIRVQAVDYTNIETGIGLKRIPEGKIGSTEVKLANGVTPLTGQDKLVSDSSNFTAGDVITIKNASGVTLNSLTISATTTMNDLVKAFDLPDAGVRASILPGGVFKMEAATDITITGGTGGGGFASNSVDGEESGWFDKSLTTDSLENIKDAKETLRLQAVTFGSNLTLLQGRENFIKEFSGTLLMGSEKIVGADINEESANLLSLNLKQQFAASALSFANEADQGVLRLLGG